MRNIIFVLIYLSLIHSISFSQKISNSIDSSSYNNLSPTERIKELSNAIKKDQSNPYLYLNRGFDYLTYTTEFKLALSDYLQAFKLFNKEGETGSAETISTTIGYIYEQLGNSSLAKKYYIISGNIPTKYKFEDQGYYYISSAVNGNAWFYHKDETMKNKNGIISSWIMMYLDPDDIPKNYLSEIDMQNYDKSKSEIYKKRIVENNNIIKTVSLWELSCGSKKMRTLSYATYDESGNIINSSNFDKPDWEHILPNSMAAAVLKKLCK